MNRLATVIVAVLAFSASSCSDKSPKRNRISGTITLAGKPIPFGEVIFTPDSTKQNTGPQGRAAIKDGKYDTASSDGMGIGGGAIVIRVNGMSGPGGKTLCEYEVKVEIPNGESTKDIDVPEKDAHNANPKGKQGVATKEI